MPFDCNNLPETFGITCISYLKDMNWYNLSGECPYCVETIYEDGYGRDKRSRFSSWSSPILILAVCPNKEIVSSLCGIADSFFFF